MSNKIKYGLKGVFYAKATIADNGTATYATPVAIPGAVNLSLSAQGDNTIFWADNIAYWIGNGNAGYDGTLEIARVPDSFKEDILGMVKDNKDCLVEDYNAEVAHFALLFQFEGDVKATKHVLYNCTCGRPEIAGSTKNESVEPQTETLPINATSIYNAGLQKDVVKAECGENSDATTYSNWTSAVYQSTGTPVVTTT